MKTLAIAAMLCLAFCAEAMAQGFSYSYRYRPTYNYTPPQNHSWNYTAPGGGYYYGNSYRSGNSVQHYGSGPRGGFGGTTYYYRGGSNTSLYGW